MPHDSWNSLSKWLHWLVAMLILAAVTLGFLADNVEMSPGKLELFVWHKSVGISVLALMLLRLLWKCCSTAPDDLKALSSFNQRASRAGHWLLYVLAIALPLSGWLLTSAANFPFKWFGLFEVPMIWPQDKLVQNRADIAHAALFWILLVLVVGHVGMVLKHQRAAVPVLSRMVPAKPGAVATICLVLSSALALVVLAWSSAYQDDAESLPIVESPVPDSSTPALSASTSQDPAVAPLLEPALKKSAPEALSVGSSEPHQSLWEMQASDSSLEFVGTYAGVEFRGGFSEFAPLITFDPEHLEASSFDVLIDTRSIFTGSPDMDDSVHEPAWFHFEAFPEARYQASLFERTETGYIARGSLRLKGIEKPVDLIFDWQSQAENQASLKGEAWINRLDFEIGSGYWAEDETIGFDVRVDVNLLLNRQLTDS